MSARPRIAGVDYGTKRVGLAVSDPLRLFAQPVGTFDPTGAVEALRQIRDRDGLQTIVIGWPLTEEGAEGAATRRVNEFVRRLRNALGRVEIVRLDERHTSEAARDRYPGERLEKGRLDTAVAGMLLQEYLDGQAQGNER